MLSEISISHVRNIESASVQFGPKFNVFFGENGSGKTSVIESIYLLATAKSFRSNQIRKIINEHNQSLTVFGRISSLTETTKIGIEKSLDSNNIRINGKTIKVVSELAERLPVLVIEQDSHKLLESGPQWRRKFIDWGLFHVKHDFTYVWGSYSKSLKQRNALLVQGASNEAIESWTEGLTEYGEMYSSMREEYVEAIRPYFTKYVSALLNDNDFTLSYRRGWSKDISLKDYLKENIFKDRSNCRTNYGPHRADLVIRKKGKDARDNVSRGQQKLLVYALNLSQVSYLKDVSDKDTMLLLDDLGSELDLNHSSNLLSLLEQSFGQVCITTANLETIPLDNMDEVKLFHVKHGSITDKDVTLDNNNLDNVILDKKSIEEINELSINND